MFSDNIATGVGGAITLFSGSAAFTRCTVSGNTAGGSGFAIWCQSLEPATFSHCTVVGNRSLQNGSGGGIGAVIASLSLRHCTIAQNTGNGFGGGLHMVNAASTVKLESCVIAQNTDLSGNAADISYFSGTLTATGANLIGKNTSVSSTFPAGPLVGTAAAPLDPNLAPLGDYGGPTKTLLPLPGSPLIDAAPGSTRTRDQRGLPRSGTPDLGAVEYQGNSDLATAWNLDTDGDGNSFGVEFALGTDPATSDPAHPDNLKFTSNNLGQPVLTFGRNPAANSTTTWRLSRSTTLLPGSFTELARHIGPTDDGSGGAVLFLIGEDFFQVIDQAPPAGGKAFYRFEAISP
jgi:Right handed beta helix region